MVYVAVSSRDPVKTKLRDDNLHGESRCERQCLESTLLCPEIDGVYYFNGHASESSELFSRFGNKFYGSITDEACKDTVIISMDFWPHILDKEKRFRGFVFIIFHGLWEKDLPEAKRLLSEYGSKVVFTYLFPNSPTGPYIEGMVGKENVELLPMPGIPEVVECNNFDKNLLLWNQRFIYQHMEDATIFPVFEWITQKLLEDKNKKFTVITGFREEDLKWHSYKPDASDQFWSYESAKILAPVRDRVTILGSIGWQDVLDLLSETKLPLGFTAQYSGIESCMYGLPFIGKTGCSPILGCEKYIQEGRTIEERIAILDRLYTDKEYYTEVGSSYRDFVRNVYTYSAFSKNLLSIMKKRGMLDE